MIFDLNFFSICWYSFFSSLKFFLWESDSFLTFSEKQFKLYFTPWSCVNVFTTVAQVCKTKCKREKQMKSVQIFSIIII